MQGKLRPSRFQLTALAFGLLAVLFLAVFLMHREAGIMGIAAFCAAVSVLLLILSAKRFEKKRARIGGITVILLICALLVYSAFAKDKNYGLLSVLFIIFCMLPFFLVFEKRRPQAREIVPIAVMAAIGALSRVIFAPLPDVKPTTAVVIITAAAFGPEAGFMTGAVSAIASNLFFGQGPWTPWQMFAWGIIGFIAGILWRLKILRGTKTLAVFGFISGFLFGWIMDSWYVIGFISPITVKSTAAAFLASFYFDLTHAVATAVFLIILSHSWIKKLDRVKIKFGFFQKVN